MVIHFMLSNFIHVIIIAGVTLDSPAGLCAQRDSGTGIIHTHVHIPRGHDGVQSSSGVSRPRVGDGERPGAVQGRQNGEGGIYL